MTENTSDNSIYTPVRSSILTLSMMTRAQLARATELTKSFKAQSLSLQADSWNRSNILFTLYDGRNEPIIAGLIEPDGRSHT